MFQKLEVPKQLRHTTKAVVRCSQWKLGLSVGHSPGSQSIRDKEARMAVWRKGCRICPEAPSIAVCLEVDFLLQQLAYLLVEAT